MANRQGDVDLREAQVSAPRLELWLGLAWLGSGHYMYHQFNIQTFYVLPTQCIYVFCVA